MKRLSYTLKYWQVRLISLLLVALMINTTAYSQDTENLAAKVYAEGFFNAHQNNKTRLKSVSIAPSIVQSYQSASKAKTPLFVFQQAEKGFVMIAESHNTFKVVGYSDEATFQPENIPPQLSALMNLYEDSLQFVNPGSMPFAAGTPVVSPLLNKYNVQLNQFGHSEVGGCPTGCVATAVAQIMLYQSRKTGKPIKGYGAYCYTDNAHGQICTDFSGITYTDDELLSFHVGNSMDMQYCGSPFGSVPNKDFAEGLEDHFHYYVGNAIPDNFFINNELEHQRPVYVELNGEPVGHAFVVDGYDSRSYYHVNFGWGGSYNGYYLLNSSDFFGVQNFTFHTNITNPRIISPSIIPVNSQDSLALVAVYNALGGYQATNWDLSNPVYKWPGVLLMNGRVIRLTLSPSIPAATAQSIAPEIGNLTALQELTLYGCFNGTIPSTISNLKDLKKLHIANSWVYVAPTLYKGNLKGELPADIDNLDQLEWLYIANGLDGTIPSSIGNLPNLEVLRIYQDTAHFGTGSLSGQIPEEIGNLTKLRALQITNQQLTGNIPSTINNLTELVEFDLSGNKLSGSIPAMNLPSLGYLKLNDNLLSAFAEGNGDCPVLTNLELQNNQIIGSFPSYFGSYTALKLLNLSDNHLIAIPEEIGNLFQLENLDVHNNQLQALPNGLALIVTLKSFSAKNNQIAYIPSNFGQPGNLETLDLSNNQLTTIPEKIGNCPKLYEIYLNDNKIDSIPSSFADIRDEATILLQNNELQGKIPEQLMTTNKGGDRFVRLDNNRFVFNDIPKSDELIVGVRNQKAVLLTKQVYKVQIGDTVSIDIRSISNLSDPGNEYFWLQYPEFLGSSVKGEQIAAFENNPELNVVIDEETIKNKYYCKVFNSQSPSYSFEYDGSTYTFPCMEYLNTDTITFELASDEELIAEKYTKEFVTSLKAIPNKTISDGTVTLVPPLKIKRGEVYWEASADGAEWERVSETMDRADLKANVKSVSSGKLELEPKNTAYYRCCINETGCDPLYSDNLKVKALGDVLFDGIVNVSEESRTIDVDSIEVVVPKNFHDSDFRMTITKLENPPAAPDSVVIGSAYDVTVSFGSEFTQPLLIKLSNIDKTTVNENDIDKYKAVYFDEINQQWKLYDHSYVSLKDSTLGFLTNHLTKLSWYRLDKVGYTDYYERNNICVYYKDDDVPYMKFIYAKNQSSQPWHISGIPLMVQDITEYLSIVMKKYKSLGLQGNNSKFTVYVKKMSDYGCVGLMGMVNDYMNINRDTESPAKLRQTLAHEFMHYTQDYYISANPGNSFWMEAHAVLSDRIVWNDTEVPLSEPEELLQNGRTSKFSIFNFLSNSWDYWDKSAVTSNVFGNIHYDYLAGTFLHYMRSYRKGTEKLEPATLLKETTWLQGWRTYLGSYVINHMKSLLDDEYEDYVKYLLSGENENFTLINKKGNPYSYLENTDNTKVFTYPVPYLFKEGGEEVQKDELEIKVPYMAAKVVLLENLTPDTMVIVNYKRKHAFDWEHLVYYGTYDYKKKEMTFLNISDSTEFNFLLEARNKENALTKYRNYSFLLLINKEYIGLSSLIEDFDASFELTARPLLDIENVGMLSIYNGDSPIKHSFDDGSDYITFGSQNAGIIERKSRISTQMVDKSTSRKIINGNTCQFNASYTIVNDQGFIKGKPTRKITSTYNQTIENNFISGLLKITEKEHSVTMLHTYIEFVEGSDGDVVERLVSPQYVYSIEDKVKTYWLKDYADYLIPTDHRDNGELEEAYGEGFKWFKTNNTSETQNVVQKIDAHYTTTIYNTNGNETGTKESSYLSTDFSNPNLQLWFIIRTLAE